MKQNVLTKACWVLFFIFPFSLFTSPLQAQRFEWAKGYASGQEGNRIVGQVTDSLGNLYILGQFRNSAAWDGGSHLLPMAPYGPYFDVNNVLIAKITPDGEMAWKKVIHCNNGANSGGYDIKKLGDTAFACLVIFSLPNDALNYCYYLDTLLTTASDYPTSNGNMGYLPRTALIIFDFEGRVLEQHFLTLTFLDNDGNDIMLQNPAGYYRNSRGLYLPSFDFNPNGNVYICRVGGDLVDQTYATWRGNVGGIKYWVDGRVVGQSEVRNSPLMWYPQLLKFSPHMDTLLASRYLVQRCDTNIDYQTDNLYLKLDYEGNPYVVGTISSNEECDNILTIDSIYNISLYCSATNPSKGYLIKFDADLQPTQCIALMDSITHPDRLGSHTWFHDIDFDADSNLIFVSASTARSFSTDTSIYYSILKCQNDFLVDLRNDAFVLIFNREHDTLVFRSYGYVHSRISSNLLSNSHSNLISKYNRIFIQPNYVGGLVMPNHNIYFSQWSDASLGIAIFDYQGKELFKDYYKAFSPNNRPGPLSLQDSILYLSNDLVSNATFGDIYVPEQGYNACVAKYVDTSFMTPYVPPTVHIRQADSTLVRLYPNPVHGRLRIDTGGEPVRSASLLSLHGLRTPLHVDGDRVDLTGCPAGVYLLEITTNNNKYHKKIIVL